MTFILLSLAALAPPSAVVEKVFGPHHGLNQIGIHELLADVALFVGALIAAASADGPGIEDAAASSSGLIRRGASL